jgi:predicted protein tyrosine phosphatase
MQDPRNDRREKMKKVVLCFAGIVRSIASVIWIPHEEHEDEHDDAHA